MIPLLPLTLFDRPSNKRGMRRKLDRLHDFGNPVHRVLNLELRQAVQNLLDRRSDRIEHEDMSGLPRTRGRRGDPDLQIGLKADGGRGRDRCPSGQ